MRNRTLLVLAAVAALSTPALAAAGTEPGAPFSVTVSAWGGWSRYDVLGLRHGVEGLEDDDELDGDFQAAGISGVLRLGWLDVGVLYEGQLLGDSDAENTVLTPLVGFAWNLSPWWRLDVLGELGGHRFAAEGADAVWLPYAGVRPTLSLRAPVGPARLVLSAAPFARWDLIEKTVEIPVRDGASVETTSYRAGGSTFGVVMGIGLEL